MNLQKTNKEIEIMKISAQICAKALKKVIGSIKPGITTRQLEQIAQKEIEARGASPAFMKVEDYKWTICTTINEQVVHGIPNDVELKNGDIIGIDIGALYQGYNSDLAITVPVGEVSKETKKFLQAGKKTLDLAISKAKIGAKIGDISNTIQNGVEGAGYSVVESLTGHGVGKSLHEEPYIPGVGKAGSGPKILENMTLALEVIYAKDSGDVVLEDDGWTISTRDKSLGGLFEQTVLTTKDGPIVLTPYL